MIVVLAMLFVSYATSLRAFLGQREHIAELEAQIARDQQAIGELREEQRRWQDPAYIEAQARKRFGWVMPGEVGFRVIGEDGEPIEAGSQLTDPSSMGRDPDAEWWSTTWASIRDAGVQKSAGPGPAEQIGPVRQRRGDRGEPGERRDRAQGDRGDRGERRDGGRGR